MSRQVRYVYSLLLVGMVLALTVAGMGSARAQQQGTQTPGAGFDLQTGDTLGSVLGQFDLTEAQVREFLVENAHLVVAAGQTVTFPAGVPVTGGAGGPAGVGTSTAQPAATGAAGGVGTPAAGVGTPQATATVGLANTAQATSIVGVPRTSTPVSMMGTPAAVQGTPGAVQGTPVVGIPQTGFQCVDGEASPGQTYVTQEGDTLGTLLRAMGMDVPERDGTGGQMGTGTPAAGGTGGQTGTGTPAAGGAGGQVTGTPSGTGGQVSGTPAAGGAGQVTNDQVLEFVYLNCDLRFDDDTVQSLVVPAGIPQTGGAPQGQGTAVGTQMATGAAQVTATQQATAAVQATATRQPTVAAQATATQQPQATATSGSQAGGQATAAPGGQATAIPPTGPQPQAGGGDPYQSCHPYADPGNLARNTAIYVARSGDSAETIARQFGMTLDDLLALNPQIGGGRMIFNQQWILVTPGERVVVNPPGWEERCNTNP